MTTVDTFIALLAVACLSMGMWMLTSRRPLTVRLRRMWFVMCVGFFPSLLDCITRMVYDGPSSSDVLFAFVVVVLLAVCWFQLQGFVFWGVKDDSLRDALYSALDAMALAFDERSFGVCLSSLDSKLYLSAQGWIGTAQLRITPSSQQELLKQIVQHMATNLGASSVNPRTGYSYIALGVLWFLAEVARLCVI